MRIDIENKILIPFMILTILPIIILGMVSYWNGYQLLMTDKTKNMEASLKETIAFVEMVDNDISRGIITKNEGQEQVKEYLRKINKANLIIIENKKSILNNSKLYSADLEQYLNSENNTYNKDNILLVYDKFQKWNWTFIIAIDKTDFMNELLEIQKYILLMAIIFLVLSMQSIIFIAHNISKPIKKFAEVCKRIEIDNLQEKIDINRSDELGILANSFNNMIDQLNTSAEEIMEMKKYNDDILKNVSIGIMTTDKTGSLLTINETGENIIEKYKKDESILIEMKKQTIQTINEQRNISTIITINKIAENNSIYFDVSTSLLKKENDEISGAICCFNDITKRRTLENNIVRVNRLASVGQFAAGLAHEIRNPLTGIKTSIQVIRSRMINTNEASNLELADGITYEIDRINSLITDLLDFSKPKQAYHEKESVVILLKKSIDMVSETIRRKEISIDIQFKCETILVFVDKGQVEQIFINIISNALDAMDVKGKITIYIENIIVSESPYTRVTIEDNGSGIDEDNLDKIFDPFFTTKPKGTGLGLSVVSKLVEENGGKIEIESKKEIGTKVKIYLPLCLEDKI